MHGLQLQRGAGLRGRVIIIIVIIIIIIIIIIIVERRGRHVHHSGLLHLQTKS